MAYVQKKRRDASKVLSKTRASDRDPREVTNPLATETGLDPDDEDTKRLHEIIKESQLQ